MASNTLPLIIVGIAGALCLVLAAYADRYDPGEDDEEEEDAELELVDTSRSDPGDMSISDSEGGGSYTAGGPGYSSGSRVKAAVTDDPGRADVTVRDGPMSVGATGGGPVIKKGGGGNGNRRGSGSGGRGGSGTETECRSCGAINKSSNRKCWSCGARPGGTLNIGSVGDNGKRAQDEFLQKISGNTDHYVEKGEEPGEPAPDPTVVEEDETTNTDPAEDDPLEEEEIPLYYRILGELLGFLDKWKTLVGTHMRSMAMAAATVAGFWSLSLIYGAARFGASGFTALFGASLIAVISAGLSALFYLSPGRRNTDVLGFPFAFTTVFLPPTVIALYEPQLSGLLWQSKLFAEFLLETIFAPIGLEGFLRSSFNLEGESHLIMWFILSFPFGWLAAGVDHLLRDA
jgi:hypothetical protein